MICSTDRYFSGYEMKKNEIGWEFWIYCVEGMFIQELEGKHEGKCRFGDLDVDGRIILKLISKFGWQSVDWISVADCTDSAICCENHDELWGFIEM